MSIIKCEKAAGRVRNRPLKDYAGTRFGLLVAQSLVCRDESKENNHVWRFSCDCGGSIDAKIKNVRGGKTQSCGCLATAALVKRNTTHGLSRKHPREYLCWKEMRARCNTPSNTNYHLYGARGISVCERWGSFKSFIDDMGTRPHAMSIDRINVNGHYEPGNCRWADGVTQANNKRTNHVLTIDGESRTLAQWCKQYGVEPSKVRYRLKVGMSPLEALTSGDLRRVRT